jgi:hypothetical protein
MPEKRHWNARRKTSAKGKLRARRPESLFEKRYTTFARANTARAQASRRLPSGCLKHGEPASNFRHQKRAQHQRKLVSKPSENYATANRPPSLQANAQGPGKRLSSANRTKLHRRRRCRGMPNPLRTNARRQSARLRQRRQPEHARSKNEFAMIAFGELMPSAYLAYLLEEWRISARK